MNTTIYGTCYDLNKAVTERYLFYAEVKTGEQNVDENYTEVTVALKVCRNPYYAYASSAYNLTHGVTVKLTIDGSEVYSTTSADIDTRNAKIWTFTTKTKNVAHADDGSKTVAIKASFSGADVSSLDSGSLSGEVELDTIPRASGITAAGAVTLGNKCSVKWTPASKDFRYMLKFSLGDWSGATGIIHPNQTSAYTYTGFPIPLEVAEQITDSASASMKVTLYTYSDEDGKIQVGGTSSTTFTVTVPNNSYTMPTVTATFEPVSSLDDSFAGLYIQGKTKVEATITAKAKYEAEIAETYLKVEGVNFGADEDYTSGYLSKYGTVAVYAYAKDSRGILAAAKRNITVIGYSVPQILPASGESDVVAARCDADGNLDDAGTYLIIKARRSYSGVVADDVQMNFCKIQYRYKANGGSYSAWKTILAADSLESDEVVTGALLGGALSAQATYQVQVQAIDDLGEYARTTITVPTEQVYWHRDGARRAFSFGEYVEEDNTFALAADITLKVKGPIDAQGSGNVDCLIRGIKLTATADAPLDLDDLKTPGNYYSPNAETSQNIAHTPYTAGGFGLTIRQLQTVDFIRQELIYGRNTWMRHFDGETWSNWWRYQTTTMPETAAVDYVIETGTEGGWTYKKWKGGTYEAFGTFTVTPTASSLHDTLYRTDNMTIALPFKISSAYVSGCGVGHYWITNGGISGDSKITLRLMSDRVFDTATAIEVRLTVVGTYA